MTPFSHMEGIAQQLMASERAYIANATASIGALHHVDTANFNLALLAKEQLNRLPLIHDFAKQIQDQRQKDIESFQVAVSGNPFSRMESWPEAMRMAYESSAAQAILSRLPDGRIGAGLFLDDAICRSLTRSIEGMTGAYVQLTDSLSLDIIDRLPPALSSAPPVEVLFEARLAWVTSVDEDESDADEDFSAHASNVTAGAAQAIDDLLGRIDQGFVSMLMGARAAARSGNPDRGRHVATSIRELITAVLHRLAPDDRVLRWATDPHHVHNGRPTRKARLSFICREVDHGLFTPFLEADYKATVEFFDACNAGTHRLPLAFTDAQLGAMVARAEGLLFFLVTLGKDAT